MDVLLYDFPGSICCQMVRLTLAEKGVAYEKRLVDIGEKREQFSPWYVKLNPKGVVPTLSIDGEIVCDTKVIVPRIDASFEGPALTPADAAGAERMKTWMSDIMAPHYGVLLYSRGIDENGVSARVAERFDELTAMREARPEDAELLDKRIAGNARFQAILKDPTQIEAHIEGTRELTRQMNESLMENEFIAGDAYSCADTFATAALARFHMHGYQSWWTEGALPAVERYYAAVQARPSWNEAGVVNDTHH